ncbi:hypothetical protein [Mycolicibacterium vanbaalenii]|nr:hypothetical protein [Mycolicibacterium vanbaalenii]
MLRSLICVVVLVFAALLNPGSAHSAPQSDGRAVVIVSGAPR